MKYEITDVDVSVSPHYEQSSHHLSELLFCCSLCFAFHIVCLIYWLFYNLITVQSTTLC